jgi:hypothetical protein
MPLSLVKQLLAQPERRDQLESLHRQNFGWLLVDRKTVEVILEAINNHLYKIFRMQKIRRGDFTTFKLLGKNHSSLLHPSRLFLSDFRSTLKTSRQYLG